MEADPQRQKAFEAASKQALGALTSDGAARSIAQDARTRGADAAIADAVRETVQNIARAAQDSGVKLPPDVLEASMRAVAKVLVGMMAGAGLKRDPDEVMAGVEKRLGIEPPEDTPADEQEDMAEGEDVDDPEEMA